ncbi:MAG TPA: nitrate/nitrite transporter NrtS [Sphingomonadaceae bacterium]|nr:nitrate/nitrite transporter NrtS [Sphingomonadaceae bacterium]
MERSPLRRVLRPPILTRSLWVALVIGTVLNLINQGDRLADGAPLDWGKIVLTFAVPFLVASYGAWSALASGSGLPQGQGEKS